jgi:hypothetical protein
MMEVKWMEDWVMIPNAFQVQLMILFAPQLNASLLPIN